MSGATIACVAAAALVATLVLAGLLRRRAALPVAQRNARSLHTGEIPRVGGVAIWAGFVPVACLAPALPAMGIATWGVPFVLVVAVSLRDDMRGVAIAPRLATHALAAFAFAWSVVPAGAWSPLWLAVVTLAVAWSLNLYNFMDGSDGLAATTAVLGFAAYGGVLAMQGAPAALPLCVAAATLPVLAANLPPARIFLGDVGAVPLGFLAAAFGVAGIVDGAWAWWLPPLAFLPFIADASVTLARRALAGERFWEGHKSHYYQRLHQMGAGHRGTLAVFGALAAGTAGTAAVVAVAAPAFGPLALAAWCTVCAVLFAAIDYHWRKHLTTT